MTARVLCLLIGYCFGLFQTGYFYGKRRGVDIRTMGSGNAGTTNALRSLGLKAGLITMAGDILKCILAVLVTWLVFRNAYPDLVPLLKTDICLFICSSSEYRLLALVIHSSLKGMVLKKIYKDLIIPLSMIV